MTRHLCSECGAPMRRLTTGGQEPNGKRRDGSTAWRPSTTQSFQCSKAAEAVKARRAELERALNATLAEEFANHDAWIRLPWPIT